MEHIRHLVISNKEPKDIYVGWLKPEPNGKYLLYFYNRGEWVNLLEHLESKQVINHLNKTFTLAGVVSPESVPENSIFPVFYIAKQAGIYSYFDGIEIKNPSILYKVNNTWESIEISKGSSLDISDISDNSISGSKIKDNTIVENKLSLELKEKINDKPIIPTVNNATITIQKNGETVDSFTSNQASAKTINITVPTTAADVSALPASTKYGYYFDLSINSETYVVSLIMKDQNGNAIGETQTIDLPLESVVVNGSYDKTKQKIVLTLESGSTIDVPVGDLIAGLQTEITSTNKLSADLIADGTINKTVTENEKNTWNNKQDSIPDIDTIRSNASAGKDASDTIETFGDIVTHNISEINDALATKQNIISDLETIRSNTHTHSNKSVLDTITENMTTKWNKSIPFEDSYIFDANKWLTNGYTKVHMNAINLPSGARTWGILFFIAENTGHGTGTQMYFPISQLYAGRIFYRHILNKTAGDWNLIPTNTEIQNWVESQNYLKTIRENSISLTELNDRILPYSKEETVLLQPFNAARLRTKLYRTFREYESGGEVYDDFSKLYIEIKAANKTLNSYPATITANLVRYIKKRRLSARMRVNNDSYSTARINSNAYNNWVKPKLKNTETLDTNVTTVNTIVMNKNECNGSTFYEIDTEVLKQFIIQYLKEEERDIPTYIIQVEMLSEKRFDITPYIESITYSGQTSQGNISYKSKYNPSKIRIQTNTQGSTITSIDFNYNKDSSYGNTKWDIKISDCSIYIKEEDSSGDINWVQQPSISTCTISLNENIPTAFQSFIEANSSDSKVLHFSLEGYSASKTASNYGISNLINYCNQKQLVQLGFPMFKWGKTPIKPILKNGVFMYEFTIGIQHNVFGLVPIKVLLYYNESTNQMCFRFKNSSKYSTCSIYPY